MAPFVALICFLHMHHPASASGYEDYCRHDQTSPWSVVEGWHFKTAFHDPMHMIFLGTCRDLYPSSMGYWMRNGFFGTGSLGQRLFQFSKEMKEACHHEGCLAAYSNMIFNGVENLILFPPKLVSAYFCLSLSWVSFSLW